MQGLAELIWGAASSGMRGLREDLAAGFYAAVSARWGQFELRELVRVLHGLAWLQQAPDTAWSEGETWPTCGYQSCGSI